MNKRYCIQFLVEAATPLKVGTGTAGITIDELVVTDVNGMPMIPGTSIAGVLNHSLSLQKEDRDSLFGFQNGRKGQGSRLVVSEARMVGEDGIVLDGISNVDKDTDFYQQFRKLVVRDHCKINEKGATVKNGKFDSQAVYKGARFVFKLEIVGDDADQKAWVKLINLISSPAFRLGGGTRKGFGELKVINMDQRIFDLEQERDLTEYLNKSSRLAIPTGATEPVKVLNDVTIYELKLQPDDFFSFTSGYSDGDIDSGVKKEKSISWENNKPKFSNEQVLIPATSVKGAVSHRTAFHYNKLEGNFADNLEDLSALVGEKNLAVKELFGCAKNSQDTSEESKTSGIRGRVMISDVYVKQYKEKIFNHVAIDRFTGGAIDGALFDEKVVTTKQEIILKFVVENSAFKVEKVQEALEAALLDITTGMLPLGGSTMRGHGCFNGTLTKNGEAK